MTMMLNNIIHELHRKYHHTFIFTKVSGKEVLAYVDSLVVVGEGNKATGDLTMTTREFGVLKYKIPTSQKLIFRLPKSQVYQYGKSARFVWRKPARQWARGITSDNTGILSMDRYILYGGSPAAMSSSLIPFTLDEVSAAFEGKYHTVQEGLDLLASGKYGSVALPGNWSLVLSPTAEEDGYVLLYKLIAVARVSRTGNILRILNSLYEDSARNLFAG